MSGAIEAAADRLLAGTPGSEVLAELRNTFLTANSFSGALSEVRKAVLRRNERPEGYEDEAGMLTLMAFVSSSTLEARAIHAFLEAPLIEQYRIQREHAVQATWSAGVEAALANIRLLPATMDTFHLTRDETITLKRKREAATLQRNASLLIVPDFAKLLATATEMLRTASVQDSFSRLILPLLLVSGRRLTEVCSPASTFVALPDRPHHATFGGALKKRGRAPTFTIPLLVPYTLFASALTILREKQGPEIAGLTNVQLKRRFQPNCHRDLHERNGLPGMPKCRVHDLRGTYAAAVNLLFDCPHSINYTSMQVLCHDHLYESLSYTHVRLEGYDALENSLGSLGV